MSRFRESYVRDWWLDDDDCDEDDDDGFDWEEDEEEEEIEIPAGTPCMAIFWDGAVTGFVVGVVLMTAVNFLPLLL